MYKKLNKPKGIVASILTFTVVIFEISVPGVKCS